LEIRYFISVALRNLWESKVTSLFTAVTLSVALGFLGTYLAIFINMKAALGAVSEKFPLTVYLSDGLSASDREGIEAALKKDAVVAEYGYTSKEKALNDFAGEHKGEGSLIGSLDRNRLL
jgi:cell division protein FtsX